jgi:hypothetical protein
VLHPCKQLFEHARRKAALRAVLGSEHRVALAGTCGAYSTPEAGTRTAYAQCVPPREQAALGFRYVRHAGGGYA